MTTYVRLLKFTEKGSENIKDFPKMKAEFEKAAKKLGITVKAFYITLGRYDAVVIEEAPDEKTILRLETAFAGPAGFVRLETLTAVPAEEFEKIVMAT